MRQATIIKVCFLALLAIGLFSLVSSASETSPAVNSLRVETQENTVKFILGKAGAIDYQDFKLSNPDRLIVDLIGAKHLLPKNEFQGDGRLVEKVRTSQFTNAPNEVTRLVFDLKKGASHTIKESGDQLVIEFAPSNVGQSPKQRLMAAASMNPSMPAMTVLRKDRNYGAAQRQSMEPKQEPIPPMQVSQSPALGQEKQSSRRMDLAAAWRGYGQSAMSAPAYPEQTGAGTGAFSMARNKSITIDVQNADIKTVLQSLSEFSGINIIAGPEVEGDVTVHLKNVPWKQAMQIILKAHGFGYREEYGIIRVSTIQKLTKEELEKESAERKKDELLPLTTKIVPLAYANAEEMQKALKKLVSQRGSIEVEKGSNALIVSDIQKNVDKIEMMAKDLDKKINQVEIVAKLVDVDIGATTDMGIRWDFLNLAPAGGDIMGDAVIDASSPAPIGQFRVGTVRSWGQLQAVLDMLEQKNMANIVSNPRIVTADNREASILVGKEIPLIVSDEAGNPITELTKVGIGLRVTPHINLDNTITLDLHPQVSELSAQATVQGGVIISLSEADTRVMVDDGETAVIGGLISQVESSLERGLPILKDVPVLGNLFKYKNKTKSKRELIIFITPRIVSKLTSD